MLRVVSAGLGAVFACIVSTAAVAATVPAETIMVVTPSQEITSKKMHEGDKVAFQVANDVVEGGAVVIPRGTPVRAEVTWRTGKGIVGKSAKFEVTFRTLALGGREWQLKGKARQEGRGNTAGALLGSMIITGRSAIMEPGQLINAFTAEPITVQ